LNVSVRGRRVPKRKRTANAAVPTNGASAAPNPPTWNLRLYIAGQTPRSTAALANLKRICEEHLRGRYTIEVIDLMKSPHLARAHQIVAIPTLVRELPEPLKRIVGDLSNTERALVGLDVRQTA
jgi:circadian clock protein KaiB